MWLLTSLLLLLSINWFLDILFVKLNKWRWCWPFSLRMRLPRRRKRPLMNWLSHYWQTNERCGFHYLSLLDNLVVWTKHIFYTWTFQICFLCLFGLTSYGSQRTINFKWKTLNWRMRLLWRRMSLSIVRSSCKRW